MQAVRGLDSSYLLGTLLSFFLAALFISTEGFLFGSLSSSLGFSFIESFYSSFSQVCKSRATSSTGCPEYAWKKDAALWCGWYLICFRERRHYLDTRSAPRCRLEPSAPRMSPVAGLCWHLRDVRPWWRKLCGKRSFCWGLTVGCKLLLRHKRGLEVLRIVQAPGGHRCAAVLEALWCMKGSERFALCSPCLYSSISSPYPHGPKRSMQL